ncbi:Os12g0271750, partial [Oryza sativa Japonica Group]
PFCLASNRVPLNLDTSALNSVALNTRWDADSDSHPRWHVIQR